MPLEDLIRSASLLVEAMAMRRHYMDISSQSFPSTLSLYLTSREVPQRMPNKHKQSADFNRALLSIDSKQLNIILIRSYV